VRYTPEGGVINAILTVRGGKVLLTISNTFKPANESEINHIFEPFYRGAGSPRMNAEGKGLGLYISRYIVRSHGGDITLNRTDNNLFSLTVSLPTK
jgi:signal transduction histidine kinase